MYEVTLFEFGPTNTDVAAEDESGGIVTYRQLSEAAEEIQSRYEEKCLVFVFCRNTIGCVAAISALLEAGHVPLLLSADMDQRLVHPLFDTYTPELVFAPRGSSWVGCEDSSSISLFDYVGCESQIQGEVPTPLHPDLAMLLTTSGSTGSAKVVRLSSGNVKSNARAIAGYLKLDERERPITSLPLNYTYGLSVLTSHLVARSKILVTGRSLLERGFWDFAREKACTSLAGVPYTYHMLDRLGLDCLAFPSLKTLTQAGGRLEAERVEKVAKFAAEHEINFFVMYGQTEATARMTYLSPNMAGLKPNSVGQPIQGSELFVVNEIGEVIAQPFLEGQLIFQGPSVAMGYGSTRLDLGVGDEWNGKLATGDQGYFDVDGDFYVTGRLRRICKIHGKRIHLDDLEDLLLRMDVVAACADLGDKVGVFVESRDVHFVATNLVEMTGFHPSAFDVRPVGALPRLQSGKINYLLLVGTAE